MIPLKILYTNWRGETKIRNILPISVRYGSNEWHITEQWLMLAQDADNENELREFAMKDMQGLL